MLTILFSLLSGALSLYMWVVIIAVLFSNLTAFGVIDRRQPVLMQIGDFLYRATEPVLSRVRRVLPNLGSIDLSPIVVILALWAAQQMLARIYTAIVTGDLHTLLY